MMKMWCLWQWCALLRRRKSVCSWTESSSSSSSSRAALRAHNPDRTPLPRLSPPAPPLRLVWTLHQKAMRRSLGNMRTISWSLWELTDRSWRVMISISCSLWELTDRSWRVMISISWSQWELTDRSWRVMISISWFLWQMMERILGYRSGNTCSWILLCAAFCFALQTRSALNQALCSCSCSDGDLESGGAFGDEGLNASQTELLPTKRFDPAHSGGKTACQVCLMDFDEDEELRTLPCLHDYHVQCVDRWLEDNTSCPICRWDVRSAFE
ncbi:uncharacterized protein LOC136762699 [Amia ocellicauda]|uniref:uncharacterized protein LOC136762699 n=1 Tax=Amia ocellicauda TaxID=2972642 RepID=UPI0034642C34